MSSPSFKKTTCKLFSLVDLTYETLVKPRLSLTAASSWKEDEVRSSSRTLNSPFPSLLAVVPCVSVWNALVLRIRLEASGPLHICFESFWCPAYAFEIPLSPAYPFGIR